MTQTDAAILLSCFSSIILPWSYAWMKSNIFPDWLKFIIVCIICAVGGYLTAYVAGTLVTSLSFIQFSSVVGAAGAGIYVTVFQKLGLERVLFPRAAAITEAQKSIAAQVGIMSHQTIQDAADPEKGTSIRVTAERVESETPSPIVLPKV